MAGTLKEARLASTFIPVPEDLMPEEGYPYDLPDGWIHLGSGGYRTVFLSPRGWVYKILNGRWRDDNTREYNEMEFNNYVRCSRDKIKGWYVPKTTLYYVDDTSVIAMEYIDGEFDGGGDDEPVWNRAWDAVTEIWDMIDLHPWNVLVMASGTRALIDLGP